MPCHDLEILYEDRQMLVVNKPACLATMGVSDAKPCLLKAARRYLASTRSSGRPSPLAMLGRLDFPVAGIVMMAKSSESARRLSQPGAVAKTYYALVSGVVRRDSATCVDWLRVSKRHRVVEVVPEGEAGARFACLEFVVLRRFADATLLSVGLQTGRKHQIRVQLSRCGHPIWGDRKYGSATFFPRGIALLAKRAVLTATGDQHFQGWEVDYPAAWRQALPKR